MKIFSLYILLAGALVSQWPAAAIATVKMPSVFGNHMVLQQGFKLSLWGTADPGEAVTVTISGRKASATAGTDGNWRVSLDPLPASGPATELQVRGTANTLDFKDVLIGEVWVCSGQSNMEYNVAGADDSQALIASGNQPAIRLFHVPHKATLVPQGDCEAKWEVCTPEVLARQGPKGVTAVGYVFGKEIHDTRKVPVGLIETYWGGTPAQSWTPLEALEADPALKGYAGTLRADLAKLPALKEAFEQEKIPAWQKAHDDWQAQSAAPHRAAMEQWKKDSDAAKAAGQPPLATPPPPKPEPAKPQFFAENPFVSSALFDGMVCPVVHYGIKGVVWYQGEANGGSVPEAKLYATLFPTMITAWRRQWGEGDFPFLFVQLAAFGPGKAWPFLRDSQTHTLSLPDTGMAVAMDIGNQTNIHPKDKIDVGHRLALAARHVAYGEDIIWSGPTYAGMKTEGPAVKVSFNHRGGGLMLGASPAPGPGGVKAAPADALEGFEIAGPDGAFVPAAARIEGDMVSVSAPAVAAPAAVRYGWQGFSEVNLYNREGLPAVPFDSRSTPIVP